MVLVLVQDELLQSEKWGGSYDGKGKTTADNNIFSRRRDPSSS